MKAILVIDMPDNCAECYLASSGTSPSDDWCCHGKQVRISTDIGEYIVNKKIELDDIDTIQSWCPLKPIPNEACQILIDGLDAMEKMKSVEVRVVRRTE